MIDLFDAIGKYIQRIATSSDPLEVFVELALIALVVWWGTRFLRGTRGASLVKGIENVI